MKGRTEMIFNLNYAELLGRELQRNRKREAERERLIRQVSGWNHNSAEETLIILRDRGSIFWSWITGRKISFPISQMPDKSSTL